MKFPPTLKMALEKHRAIFLSLPRANDASLQPLGTHIHSTPPGWEASMKNRIRDGRRGQDPKKIQGLKWQVAPTARCFCC